jgi:hypothetical protein
VSKAFESRIVSSLGVYGSAACFKAQAAVDIVLNINAKLRDLRKRAQGSGKRSIVAPVTFKNAD